MELVSLSPEGGGSIELMATFLNLLLVTLEVHQDFEAVHAYLGLFLKHHSDTVIENEELIEALTNLQPVLNQSWSDLKNTGFSLGFAYTRLFFQSPCLVLFVLFLFVLYSFDVSSCRNHI